MEKGTVVKLRVDNGTQTDNEYVVTSRHSKDSVTIRGYGLQSHPQIEVSIANLIVVDTLPVFVEPPKDVKYLDVEYRAVYYQDGDLRTYQEGEERKYAIVFFSVYVRYFDEETESPIWCCVADLYSEEEAIALKGILKNLIQ